MIPAEPSAEVAALHERLRAQEANLALLAEATADAERVLAAEDVGWEKLGAGITADLSRADLRSIIARARRMYLRDPLVNRGVNIQAHYVWAQGINIQATDENVNAVVQTFLDDTSNQAELTAHQARTLKEVDLQVLGNLFFCFFTDARGNVRVRTIPVDQVEEIICNPEDRRDVWYYRRVWEERALDGHYTQRIAHYPDWRKPADASVPGGEVVDVPVYHVRVGALSDMLFGLPEVYQALDWAKAYKEFLEDRATMARALSRFAWRLTTPGGARGIAAAKAKLGTTLGMSTSETNPPPLTGSTFIGSKDGADMEPIKLAGATISPEEGRRFLLQVAAAMGLPETMFGDVSVGTLATAKAMDRPTQLKFRDRQQLWQDVLQAILQYVIERKVQAGELAASVDRHIDVSFPDLLEEDVTARVSAIVAAVTLDGKATAGTIDDRTTSRLLLTALGVDQVDELLDQIAPEGGESLMGQMARAKAEQAQVMADRQAQAAQQSPQQPPDQQPAAEAMMVRAVEELREALASISQ